MDTIGDLPKVENGASKLTLEVTTAPTHPFLFSFCELYAK